MNKLNNDWLYETENKNIIRYILGTKGINPLICIGINPSKAKPNDLDNTLESVQRIAIINGFDSWIMLNIYPQRATNPNDMHQKIDTSIHEINLSHIKELLCQYSNPVIWAAWGTLIEKRKYLIECLNDIYILTSTYNCKWVKFGKISKKGHPHHPLYLKSDSTLELFGIKDYINKFGIK
jgi:hypothetical protein